MLHELQAKLLELTGIDVSHSTILSPETEDNFLHAQVTSDVSVYIFQSRNWLLLRPSSCLSPSAQPLKLPAGQVSWS